MNKFASLGVFLNGNGPKLWPGFGIGSLGKKLFEIFPFEVTFKRNHAHLELVFHLSVGVHDTVLRLGGWVDRFVCVCVCVCVCVY